MSEGNNRPAPGDKAATDPALRKWIGLGVGAGVGSAAIAAALLYASRTSRPKSGGEK